jgi:undecaprenyl diphosphate synthase
MTNEQSQPQHLAIIMDGNRRWAKEKLLPSFKGHTEGAETLRKITEIAAQMGIPYLTFYALSTENLAGRSEDELKHLFSLIEKMTNYLPDFQKNEIQVRIIGDISKIPEHTQNVLQSLVAKTKNNKKLILSLAINYGGRDEIVRAVKKIIADKISPEDITETLFERYLDTSKIPDVDLMIRTGGAKRLSNYLPWQSAYAELYFLPKYWPDFDKSDLETAIQWFNSQKRNKGK